MTLRSRRIIYTIFILLFLAVTPIIILYTAGYRYNFQKHKIQKTGILILKSKPEKATIFLNNKLQKNTTPARIVNLLPGDYSIKIEKDGYYPWEKTLPIESRLTTFAENILLFKKSLPTKIIDSEVDSFILSPDKQKIIYFQTLEAGKEIWLLNFKTFKKSILYRSAEKNNQKLKVEWDQNSQNILITNEDEITKIAKYIVFNLETQETSVYQNLNEFYFKFKGLNDKLIEGNQLEALSFIQDTPQNFLATLNKKNQNLTILDNDSGLIIFQTKADYAAWLKNGNKILYINDYEIWTYDSVTNEEHLITRYSQEIKKALWLNDNYILILLDNTIKVIELDERDQRNIIDLVTLESIDDFDINTNAQKIYFTGILGNKKGVFELPY